MLDEPEIEKSIESGKYEKSEIIEFINNPKGNEIPSIFNMLAALSLCVNIEVYNMDNPRVF